MKNFKTIITLLIGITIGFSFCQLFHRNADDSDIPAPTVQADAATIKTEVAKIEKQYQQKEDSLNEHNDSLGSRLKQTETALTKAKRKNGELQQQVYTLIDRQSIFEQEKDTASYFSNCDSLARLTSQLIIYSAEKDSLSQISIETLGAQVQNRDSAIVLKLSQYQQLKTTLSQTLSNQQALQKEVKQLRKKFKRQRFWGKLKNAGLLILSGLAAKQLLH
jgi:chromosome segregation ATPase